MPVPLQISFHGIDHSDALEARIREWGDKLERVYDRIERIEVAVEEPHHRHQKGNRFHVRVLVRVPGQDVVVGKDPGRDESHEDPYVAVRDAFRAARRRLEDHARKLRVEVKKHRAPEHARVAFLDVEGEWGWLEAGDGRRVYFHRNSVLDGTADLAVGAEVRFHEEPGERGPQASTVELIGANGRHELPRDA